MTNVHKDQAVSGSDPKGEVFAALAALVYAAEKPVSGTYIDQSRVLAASIDAAVGGKGLYGSRVLDIGCGFGTTTEALCRYAPASVTAVDSSEAMVSLLYMVLIGEEPIESHLERYDAKEKLRSFYPGLLTSLREMRRGFRGNLFQRMGGTLLPAQGSCLKLANQAQEPFDAIAANNMLHWPLKAAMEKEEYADAFRSVFSQLSAGLTKSGICGAVEPKDFMDDDLDPKRNADLEAHETMSHPVRRAYEARLNQLLKERHGIERGMPRTTKLFQTSRLPALLEECGLKLESMRVFESVRMGDPFDSFAVRAPMSTGTIDLPIETKLDLGIEAARLARQDLEGQEYGPVYDHYFVWIMRKR